MMDNNNYGSLTTSGAVTSHQIDDTAEEYIPVNKGHFDLEPLERSQKFSEILARGWENEYNEYRSMWNALPQKKQVRDYPLLVDLELSSRCNLKCPMCPTVTEEFINLRVKPYHKGALQLDLAKKIIDEISGHVFALRLSWVGEPTLNPNFLEILSYAKYKGIQEVSLLTNGVKLRPKYFEEMVQAGVDWITISVDGMGDTYNFIRSPLKFEDTVEKIRYIHDFKLKHKLEKPVIKIQGIWPSIKESPEEFYNLFAPITDLVAFNPLIDYLHNDEDIEYVDNFSCPQLYQRIVVSSNGKVALCSNDDNVTVQLGDANTQSIHEIWHGEKMNTYRQHHAEQDGFKRVSACARCYYPRKTYVEDTAIINGREIQIENYTNRSQKIGE